MRLKLDADLWAADVRELLNELRERGVTLVELAAHSRGRAAIPEGAVLQLGSGTAPLETPSLTLALRAQQAPGASWRLTRRIISVTRTVPVSPEDPLYEAWTWFDRGMRSDLRALRRSRQYFAAGPWGGGRSARVEGELVQHEWARFQELLLIFEDAWVAGVETVWLESATDPRAIHAGDRDLPMAFVGGGVRLVDAGGRGGAQASRPLQ